MYEAALEAINETWKCGGKVATSFDRVTLIKHWAELRSTIKIRLIQKVT